MPNRDLKETNRRSPSLQLLSDAAERLWYRLLTAVDDFGRLEADPEVVFTTCFQRVPKGWTREKVKSCLFELSSKSPLGDRPLIVIYEVGVRSFIQILSASAHIYRRAKESKYPAPTDIQLSQQVIEAVSQMRTDACTRTQIPSYPESRTPNSELRVPNPDPRIPNPESRTSVGNEPTQAQATGSVEGFALTPELEAWSAKEGILNPSQYLDEFKDYWRTTGGKKKNGQPVKDWTAAFRNRVRYLRDHGRLKKESVW